MSDWPQPNKHGVYLRELCESLKFDSNTHARSYAEINLIHVSENEWKVNSDITLPERGAGGLPSTSGESFATRDLALFHEIEWVKKYCSRALFEARANRQKTLEREAQKILAWCDSLRQLALF